MDFHVVFGITNQHHSTMIMVKGFPPEYSSSFLLTAFPRWGKDQREIQEKQGMGPS